MQFTRSASMRARRMSPLSDRFDDMLPFASTRVKVRYQLVVAVTGGLRWSGRQRIGWGWRTTNAASSARNAKPLERLCMAL